MKLKLDENIPQSEATRLTALGSPDSVQWRVGDHLVGWFSDPDARSWERCMVVAPQRKVRVVRGATAQR